MKGTDMTHTHEREVIVTDSRSPFGVVVGVLLAIAAIVLVGWLVLTQLNGGDSDVVPDEVNISVDS